MGRSKVVEAFEEEEGLEETPAVILPQKVVLEYIDYRNGMIESFTAIANKLLEILDKENELSHKRAIKRIDLERTALERKPAQNIQTVSTPPLASKSRKAPASKKKSGS